MWILSSLCLVVSLAVSALGQSNVRRPPSITSGPTKRIVFRDNAAVKLPCKAEGTPAVTSNGYEWRKNGEALNLNDPNIERGSDGEITINSARRKDDGYYQCFAANQHGTAISTVAHIRMAYLDHISQTDPHNMTVPEGRPFIIDAARQISYPTPTYRWEIAAAVVDKAARPFQPSQRVINACNGDLYFAYAQKEDELDGQIYKSTVYNADMDQSAGGSYTRVIITPGPSPDFAPNISYYSTSLEVALVGESLEIKCFFSGKPLPTISWSGQFNNLRSGQHTLTFHNTHLNILSIRESDAGEYVCNARNFQGTASYTHKVHVEAMPIFRQESDGPRDVNVTEGDSITFNCSAYAKPEATVVWYQNGQPIDVKNAPKRFVFSDDMKSLTIRDVCRDCEDTERKTDLMVIQCNASNVHGYAFASGYLNVLLRTKATLFSGSTFELVDLTKENLFQFDCRATSDPSTPPTVRWYRVTEKGQESVHNDSRFVHVIQGNLTLYTEPNQTDSCDKYLGEYRCIAGNEHTWDIVTVMLNCTSETTEKPPKAASLMWIVIGLTILFFILLLILICCICQLRKGDVYDVDGKERKSGRNPEEEILENDFQDYYPNEDIKRKGSAASIGSVVTFKGMDDANECDEFDENFREDGSFVGKYAS